MAGDKKKIWLGCCGASLAGVVIVCGVGGVVAFRSLVGGDAERLPKLRAEAIRLRIPLDIHDIGMDSVRDPAENAAPIYEQAFDAYAAIVKSHRKAEQEINRVGRLDQKANEKALAVAFVRDSTAVLSIAEKAASMPTCTFPHDWSLGFAVALPEYGKIRRLALLLEANAQIQAESGNLKGAYHSLLVSAKMARHLAGAVMFGALSSIGASMRVLALAGQFLEGHPSDGVAISGCQSALDTLGHPPSIREMLVSETPVTLIGIRSIRRWSDVSMFSEGSNGNSSRGALDGFVISNPTFRRAMEAKYLGSVVDMVSQFPADEDNWKGFQSAIKSATAKSEGDHSLANSIVGMFIPQFSSVPIAAENLTAVERITATSVKLLSLRADGKPLPDKLPDFGKISIDPMDGSKLKYKRVGTGFKIWAIGRDGVDHGGKMRPKRMTGNNLGSNEKYDEVLAFK